MKIKKIDKFLIYVNIILFIYYAFQLLVFTDEFAIKNIGLFNHAIAGLSEILGIIFFSLSLGLTIILFKGIDNQLPLFITILLLQFFISLNFWRYILTDSPGETNLETIMINALIFSFSFLLTLVFIFNNRKYL
tara:strand:+ start:521 stop:922 length:402 start_codon:yes stop_codon:yes gene_type:complete